ncbi:MAG: hypothetical protein VW804_05195, partial [Verrucomicrobiota bacterium]
RIPGHSISHEGCASMGNEPCFRHKSLHDLWCHVFEGPADFLSIHPAVPGVDPDRVQPCEPAA